MSATIPDILVPSNEFIDINTLADVPVGEIMTIQNKGAYNLVLQESILKPANDSEDGVIVTNIFEPYARADVQAGSIRIWARALGGACKISVQKV